MFIHIISFQKGMVKIVNMYSIKTILRKVQTLSCFLFREVDKNEK